MCVNFSYEKYKFIIKSKEFLWGEINGDAFFILTSPWLVWCPLLRERRPFSVTMTDTYWMLIYWALCHSFYALPHCLLRMLEIGTDIISVYRWGNQGLERWSKWLAQYTASKWWAGSHAQLCVHTALLQAALSETVIFPGGPRWGWVWRERLDHVLTAPYAVSWVCFEVASSAWASQKASSPLGLGFMMWFPSSCRWRSALLPQGQKTHWLLGICVLESPGALPVFRMGHAYVAQAEPVVLRRPDLCGLVWNRSSCPLHHTAHESAGAWDVKVQPQAGFSCTECDLKKKFLWAFWQEAGMHQLPSQTYYLSFQ